jgi:alkyl sulfatase BDS1-like metallo-beta-lactamase superfamily hydrolase
MNFFLPESRALCAADNVARSMHNLLTLRGALVRDAHAWAAYLDETLELFGGEAEVLFSGHHWPCWGREEVVDLLELQRDLYAYLHDQTLRLLNRGMTGPEIAEALELPPQLAGEQSSREHYGSVSHNAKAIYQRYMGWFDGNPATLWEHPPRERARRYVALAGGREAALAAGREALAAGDLRWAAELLSHVVFADPEDGEARELQAEALERLGFGAENPTWRNFYLLGARELREGGSGTPTRAAPPDIVANLSVAQLLDAMAIRLDGPRAWDADLRVDWVIQSPASEHAITVRRGVMRHRPGRHAAGAQATLFVDRAALDEIVLRTADVAALAAAGRLRVEGEGEKLGELLGLLEDPDPSFPIVTPRA